MRFVYCLILVSLLIAGCGGTTAPGSSAWNKTNSLIAQNEKLKAQVQDLQNQNQILQQQVKTFSGMTPEDRAQKIDEITSISFYRFTGIYVEQNVPRLIVYLMPEDKYGDSIKAKARIELELINLDKDGKQAAVGKWTFEPNDLSKMWGTSLLKSYYHIRLDLPAGTDPKGTYLLNVTFTDLAGGRVFKLDKILRP
jgi:outer membrane murein-binding lipoprotein Lpp